MTTLQSIYGPISVPDWEDDLIVRSLRAHGEWAYCEPMLLAPLLRETDRFWDVGAFLGTFGLGATQLAQKPPAKLLAVDPGPVLQPFLAENLKNAPCPTEIAPFAVGQSDGWLRPQGGAGANAGAIAYEASDSGEGAIPCRSLASLRAEFGDYDVIKLDVEGMENAAVRGDFEFLQRHRPVIWAECNEDLSSILLLEALVALNYEPVYVAFPAFRACNHNGSDEVIYPMAYEAALLAAPPERLAAFNAATAAGEDIIVRPVKTSFELRCAMWETPRWSMAEWTTLTRPQLIALLGRHMSKVDLVDFLNDAPQ